MSMVANENWPHQERGKTLIRDKRSQGVRSVIAAAPCGAGKSRVMTQLTEEEVAAGGSVKIYLHRTMLLEQMALDFTRKGIGHGVQAVGFEPDFDQPVQLCMLDSVFSRAVRKSEWPLGSPTLVIFDEARNQVESKARSIVYGSENGLVMQEGHYGTGAFILGFDATPVSCGGFYQELIGFASYKECRDVKAHLPVRVYSPTEIDCTGLSTNASGEFSSKKVEERATKIVGDAYAYWRRLNPDSEPAILFAPSVEGSRWFAEEWARFGVPVAHLDGKSALLPRRGPTGAIYLERCEATPAIRSEILRMSKSGEIKVLMNRFVLREAIDMPWLRHGIGATVFGGVATYLQSVGRIQRYFEGMDHKIWQDHGGGYWRHGSPNQERHWNINDTNLSIKKARAERIKRAESPRDMEGICCPRCKCWRQFGPKCPNCGHAHKLSVREVRMTNGELVIQRGVVNRPDKKKKAVDMDALWVRTLYRAAAMGQTVSQAVRLWANDCRASDIVPDASKLRSRPPGTDTVAWHQSVVSVFPWVKPKAKNA